MNTQAQHAINAARRYCENRGVHPRLFQLARQLEAVALFNNTTGA